MRTTAALMLILLVPSLSILTAADDSAKVPSRVLKEGERPGDARLAESRTLRDAYHPWVPADTKDAWERQAQAIRERILVSNGLWPMPPKHPLEPVIRGKIDRGDYTIEKVYFASHPGHYVTGNLYRPKQIAGKVPGILCPHGHWQNGRFYDAGDGAAAQIEQGAEMHTAGAHYPLQARMVQLARLGCVVFHYDMVGYADSQQISHRQGFTDATAALWLQNFMGLQTFNSIRALDFLMSLEEVDPERIGVTGASGGGTQTFMLCAIDSRPAVAFPAVMVSTAMQGGCVCENAEYLRIGLNNIAFAALFAPKPLALSGADDWTIDIETKGLPELRQVYALYGHADLVNAKCYPQFAHNYNQISREMMYDWFNAHLHLGRTGPIKERDFEAVPPAELSVFDDEHPLPADATGVDELRAYLTDVNRLQFAKLLPDDTNDVEEYKQTVGAAARVMLDAAPPAEDDVQSAPSTEPLGADLSLMKGMLAGVEGEQIPYVALFSDDFSGTTVLWLDGAGKSHMFGDDGTPIPAVRRLLDAGMAVASADLFLTGEYLTGKEPPAIAVDDGYQGYTFGYNRPLLSNRVRDVAAMISAVVHNPNVSRLHLVGTGDAGPWVLLARAMAGDLVETTLADAGGFGFGHVKSTDHPMFLPGALKYGGLGGLAALAAPAELTVAGVSGVPDEELLPLKRVYAAAKGNLLLDDQTLTADQVADRLLGGANGQ